MSEKNIENYKQKIIRTLKKEPQRLFSAKEISAKLHVKKSTYKLFKKALQELLDSGDIVRQKSGMIGLPVLSPSMTGDIIITKGGNGLFFPPEGDNEIFIPSSMLNTALNGDTVEVTLNAVRKGKSPEGKVTSIIKRKQIRFAGIFHRSKYYAFVVIDNPRVYRDFFIPNDQTGEAVDGQMVVIEMISWNDPSRNPEAKIVQILGNPEDKGIDIEAVIINKGLSLGFNEQVEKVARKKLPAVDAEEIASRLDLRDKFIFTIDPDDAKDFDDAVSLEKKDNGNYLLGVHIADVSHYVDPDSPVDKEAYDRATSVYLVDRVVPMLPEYLSNELCSLRPREEKLTFSCIMEIDPALNVVSYQIAPSVIKSKHRLNYKQAQEIIDDQKQRDALATVLREMNELAQKIRKKRLKEGGMDFFTPEVKIIMDDKGFPIDIVPVTPLQTHQLIEEFMLMANKTVAKHIAVNLIKDEELPFIYRIHESPDKEKVARFVNLINVLGYKFTFPRKVTPFFFQEVFEVIKGTDHEVLVDKVALRSMMRARYDTENIGHFGLGFTYYTHFTSPIRRYPDLIVHRLLKEYAKPVGKQRINHLRKYLKRASEHASAMERVAMEAERESIKIKQIEWISEHIGETFVGQISGVAPYGFWVEIEKYLIEGMIHISHLQGDIYIYDEKSFSLIGRYDGAVFRLGNKVEVEVIKVDNEKHEIDFRLISNLSEDRVEPLSQTAEPSRKKPRRRKRRKPQKQ